MPESYPFPIFSGLFEPKHFKRIGNALWLFEWCISATTKEEESDGVMWGLVLGSKPMRLSELAEPFGVDNKTVSRWMKDLEHHGYIRVTRAPYGLIIAVRNSKKYRERVDKNVRSDEGDKTKMSDLSQTDRTKVSDLQDKNVRSNKDIIKILIDRLIDGLDDDFLKQRCGVPSSAAAALTAGQIHLDQETISQRANELEAYFNQRKRRLFRSNADWEPVLEVAREPIPLEFALFGIDLAFAKFNKAKKRPHDSIRTFAYCKTIIFDAWDFIQENLNSPASPTPDINHYRDRKKAMRLAGPAMTTAYEVDEDDPITQLLRGVNQGNAVPNRST